MSSTLALCDPRQSSQQQQQQTAGAQVRNLTGEGVVVERGPVCTEGLRDSPTSMLNLTSAAAGEGGQYALLVTF